MEKSAWLSFVEPSQEIFAKPDLNGLHDQTLADVSGRVNSRFKTSPRRSDQDRTPPQINPADRPFPSTQGRLDPGGGIIYNTAVRKRRVVLDTSVVVAALRSRQGASYKLLSLLEEDRFEIAISVPLLFEYEDALARGIPVGLYGQQEIEDFLDYVCQVAHRQSIFFLWRPCLPDPKDDMVLELAVAARCEAIVTYNQRDFVETERLGIRIDTPRDFLRILEEPS